MKKFVSLVLAALIMGCSVKGKNPAGVNASASPSPSASPGQVAKQDPPLVQSMTLSTSSATVGTQLSATVVLGQASSTGYQVRIIVKWGDGQESSTGWGDPAGNLNGTLTHAYVSAGTYTVTAQSEASQKVGSMTNQQGPTSSATVTVSVPTQVTPAPVQATPAPATAMSISGSTITVSGLTATYIVPPFAGGYADGSAILAALGGAVKPSFVGTNSGWAGPGNVGSFSGGTLKVSLPSGSGEGNIAFVSGSTVVGWLLNSMDGASAIYTGTKIKYANGAVTH